MLLPTVSCSCMYGYIQNWQVLRTKLVGPPMESRLLRTAARAHSPLANGAVGDYPLHHRH